MRCLFAVMEEGKGRGSKRRKNTGNGNVKCADYTGIDRYLYLFYISVIYQVCIMRLLVYVMLVNVNGIYYVHVYREYTRL